MKSKIDEHIKSTTFKDVIRRSYNHKVLKIKVRLVAKHKWDITKV